MDDFAPAPAPDSAALTLDLATFARVIRVQPTLNTALAAVGERLLASVPGAIGFSAACQLSDNRGGGRAQSDPAAGVAGEILRAMKVIETEDWSGSHVTIQDLPRHGLRWPDLTRQKLIQTGIQCALILRLQSLDDPFGAVILYSNQVDALPEVLTEDVPPLLLIASLGLEAAADRDKVTHLHTALESNRLIGSAIGILMGGRRITAEQAFDLMRTASQTGHRKLRDVAEDVLYAGDLP